MRPKIRPKIRPKVRPKIRHKVRTAVYSRIVRIRSRIRARVKARTRATPAHAAAVDLIMCIDFQLAQGSQTAPSHDLSDRHALVGSPSPSPFSASILAA